MKITDNKKLMKLVSFLVMSDGSVYRNRGAGNCIFSLSATEDHADFIQYVKSIIENITSVKIIHEKREAPRKNILKVYTPVHPYFNTLRDRIYVDSYKSIDPHALKMLDFEALAILYMSDGCLGKFIRANGKPSYTLTINMCRLSYGDLLLVKKAIKDNLNLEFNVVKTGSKYYTLRLRGKDLPAFIDGVRPFILPSFHYKLDFCTIDPIKMGGDIV